MKAPILITGCARSGTSLVAGIINICGAFGGDMSGPNRNNEKGMFENSHIRQTVVKPFLTGMGADATGQYPLPDLDKMSIPVNWQHQVESVIRKQGYQDGDPWMYKGAKMCLMWPVWNFAFPTAKWIIVRRKSSDIVNSCVRTGFMKAFIMKEKRDEVGATTEQEGWLWWIHQHEERFREMMNAGLNTTVIWPERMVDGDYHQIKDMIEWLGLEWKSEEVMAFIEPKLWKSRIKK